MTTTTDRHPIVLLGLDSDQKPHAAKFEAEHEQLGLNAAVLMGFRLGRADTDKALAAIKDLPTGRFFNSGRGFTPLVSQKVFDDLTQSLSFVPLPKPKLGGPAPHSVPASLADPWEKIKVGDTVLFGAGRQCLEGFWDCTVIAAKGDTLSLVWRLAPHEAAFTARRRQVGVLAPDGLKQLKPAPKKPQQRKRR